ncbi:MAG: DUF418 domain-containing protein [Ginsengibacter sp.]
MNTAQPILQTNRTAIIDIIIGFGAGMLGRLHMQWVLPIAIVAFSIQIFISISWMKYFQFGLAEWIWRMLSYKKYIPIKK